MDAAFSLQAGAGGTFLGNAGRAIGCVYICFWTYLPQPANCLASTDGWFIEENQTPGRRLFDLYLRSFCSFATNHVPGIAYKKGLDYLEVDEAGLMSLAGIPAQRLFYQEAGIKVNHHSGTFPSSLITGFKPTVFPSQQIAVFMCRRDGEIELGVSTTTNVGMQERIMRVFSDGFSQQLRFPHLSENDRNIPAMDDAASLRPHQVTILEYGRRRNPLFPSPLNEDAALVMAMVEVISSSSSSSFAGPSSQSADGEIRRTAFSVYKSALAPTFEPSNAYPGQRMMKRAFTILRQVGSQIAYARVQESPRAAGIQLHHQLSERRRREKFNESFAELRTLLPPDTRKDRASVLTCARDSMAAMREQIPILEEKNRTLEAHLRVPEEPTHEVESAGEGVDIRVNRSTESSSSSSSSQMGERIQLRVSVRVKCDAMRLLLRILARLKEMGNVSLVSMEARGFSRHERPLGLAILNVQIERGECDEAVFMEAVARAVEDGTAGNG